jgi:hypothetical protein
MVGKKPVIDTLISPNWLADRAGAFERRHLWHKPQRFSVGNLI